MITLDEIRTIAREKGLDPTTIERDYVQNWFLKSLYTNTDYLIFKGGTSIRKAFIQDYRFSDDLDFTLSSDTTQEEMTVLINKAKSEVLDDIGILFEDGTPFKDVESGWKIKIHYTSKVTGRPVNLILDITKPDYEVIVTPVENKPIIHNFSDSCDVTLITYSLSEITAEKLRALCQRGWPRDLFDVYNLWPRIEKDGFQELFLEKCNYKGFEPTLTAYDDNEERIKSAWFKSLGHQLKEVPEFDEAFREVRVILEEMEL